MSKADPRAPNPASAIRRAVTPYLVYLYTTAIFGLPLVAAAWLVRVAWDGTFTAALTLLIAPLVYAVAFIVIAGTLSLAHHRGIVAGRFERDVGHPVYFHRRLYGLCWTSLYYNKPVYFLALSLPPLKLLAFRLFGYKGSMAFTVYPDTWIRDLPLLSFEPGAYIANRATLGTNLVMRDRTIMVDKISVGKNSVVGHLVAMAPGCVIGDDVEIGSITAIGYRSKFADGSDIQPRCAIEHGVRIGANVRVGASSYVGSASTVAPGAVVSSASVVPPRSKVRSDQPPSAHSSEALVPVEQTAA